MWDMPNAFPYPMEPRIEAAISYATLSAQYAGSSLSSTTVFPVSAAISDALSRSSRPEIETVARVEPPED